MELFKVSKDVSIVCETGDTRNGFKHIATLLINGTERETVKAFYYNRTWERYQYESVLGKLVDKTKVLTEKQKKVIGKMISLKWCLAGHRY